MQQFSFACPLRNGLHARPASALEQVARRFASRVSLRNERTGQAANAKSVLALVALDLRFDDPCRLSTEGNDEREALTALRSFVDVEFARCDAPIPPSADRRAVRLPPVLRGAEMKVRAGTSVAPGIGRGVLVRIGALVVGGESATARASDLAAEHRRLDEAFRDVLRDYDGELQRLGRSVHAEIVTAHRSVVRDPELKHWMAGHITSDASTAEGAIAAAEAHFSEMLVATGSAILRDRALDVRDVCARLAAKVRGGTGGPLVEPLVTDSICVADTLSPGQFLALDRSLVKGLVLEHGSATSHTTILARSFGIPAVADVENVDWPRGGRRELIVDGDLGVIVEDPGEAALRYYEMERARVEGRRARQRKVAIEPAATSDGVRIEVGANIGSAAEVDAASSEGAEGIGLLRTELIFAGRDSAPTEAEQFEQYRAAVNAAGARMVLVRTLDVGGDKPLPYLRLPAEDNPFLGYRGVRIYADHPQLIRDQVAAIVRASAHGRLGLMIPMVASLEEVLAVRAIVSDVQARCAADGVAFDPHMQVGAMIEVPSAAMAIGDLARELDFFSVGTNDLLQYFCAADRGNPRVGALYNPLAPAFIRLLDEIVKGARHAGRWVGVCGEMAGDEQALPILAGLGFDELSVALPRVGGTKAALRRLSAASCRALVERAMASTTASEVERLIREADCWTPVPLLEPELIVIDADCTTMEEAVKTAADRLYVTSRTDAPRDVEEAVWDREAVSTTGFGHGFAIPHCKSSQLRSSSLAVVRLKHPVDWHSLDGRPVDFVLLLAIRDAGHAAEHLKILATLARQLMHEEFRERLRREPDEQALCSFLLGRIGG